MSAAEGTPADSQTTAAPMTRGRRALLAVAVMASTIMQALDTTIVNVALPHMQGQLGASSDEIGWVLTSYLVSSAIMMPLTGYFSDRLGRRRYLGTAIVGFVAASMLCGLAQNLPQIVLFRLLQGAFGAGLVPMAQAIMADAYPPHERGHAMSIWSMGVMLGPIMGPTLGGWLTDALSWRWTFFINLPVGVASLGLVLRYCPDTERRARNMDWVGLSLISIAIGGTQLVLDRGNEDDWFSSRFILLTALAAAVALVGFVAYALTTARKPVFDLGVFRDRNFLSAVLVTTVMGVSMFGSTFAQPILLERLLDYPTATAGLVMAPRGLASMISMRLAGRLIGHIDTRVLVGMGVLLLAWGTFQMAGYDLHITPWDAMWPTLFQGFGLGLIYVPLASLQLATLPPTLTVEAAGLGMLVRTLGQSAGVSIVSTLLTRLGQSEWAQLGGHINPYDPALRVWLHAHGLSSVDARTAPLLGLELSRQAQMLALINVMQFIGWSCLAMLPIILLVRPMPRGRPAETLVLE